MFRLVFVSLCVSILLVSCLKRSDDSGCPYTKTTINAPLSERDVLKAYLDSNNIDALEHASGFFYKVINEGTEGGNMGLCSEVMIDYTGWLLNSGAQFDSQSGVTFVLGSLIEGWKTGLPLIKKGGRIQLFIPPSLAYRDREVTNQNGQVIIPANSPLTFDVVLIDYTISN